MSIKTVLYAASVGTSQARVYLCRLRHPQFSVVVDTEFREGEFRINRLRRGHLADVQGAARFRSGDRNLAWEPIQNQTIVEPSRTPRTRSQPNANRINILQRINFFESNAGMFGMVLEQLVSSARSRLNFFRQSVKSGSERARDARFDHKISSRGRVSPRSFSPLASWARRCSIV